MATGGFIGFNYGGQILANWLFGIKNHLSLKKKAYLSRIISIISIVFLVIYPSLPTFLIASVFLGVSRAIRSLIYPPVIKKISKSHDATHFFAVAPLITLPVSSGISILSGKYLDIFQQWGDWSYRSLFLILAMLIGVSFLFLKKSDF